MKKIPSQNQLIFCYYQANIGHNSRLGFADSEILHLDNTQIEYLDQLNILSNITYLDLRGEQISKSESEIKQIFPNCTVVYNEMYSNNYVGTLT